VKYRRIVLVRLLQNLQIPRNAIRIPLLGRKRRDKTRCREDRDSRSAVAVGVDRDGHRRAGLGKTRSSRLRVCQGPRLRQPCRKSLLRPRAPGRRRSGGARRTSSASCPTQAPTTKYAMRERRRSPPWRRDSARGTHISRRMRERARKGRARLCRLCPTASRAASAQPLRRKR
jgi:hypothetical protein